MEPNDKGNLDELLERALRHLGKVEPQSGLETRILANLAEKAPRNYIGSTLGWGVAMASIAALLVVIWLGILYSRVPQTQTIAGRATPALDQNEQRSQVTRATLTHPPMTRRSVRKPSFLRRSQEMHSAASEQKLNQFPSLRPLSREELLFASYAEHFPKEATLIAQEQQSFEEEIRRAEYEALNGVTVSNQER